MRKLTSLDIGLAGEHLACIDLILKGLTAFRSEQGLAYDIIIDTGSGLLRCQVKTTRQTRPIPQRRNPRKGFIFNIHKGTGGGRGKYLPSEVDLFALVVLDPATVGYLHIADTPQTLHLRAEQDRGLHLSDLKRSASWFRKIAAGK